MLSDEEVRHVAKLARISLKDEDVKRFGKQMSDVLDYMDVLNEVDTAGVPQTSQVTGLTNVMEEDEVLAPASSREDLLACSELPLDSNQVRVIRVVK